MEIILKNGHIVDPSSGSDAIGHVVIQGNKITKIAAPSEKLQISPQAQVIDAVGLYVFPGLVDIHVHLREPGFTHKETIASGSQAGVKGGFTTLCCMPNTNPPNDNEAITQYIVQKGLSGGAGSYPTLRGGGGGGCNVHPIGAITKRQEGKELTEMGIMKAAGCVAFSDDGRPVTNSLLMRRALEYSTVFDVPIISHAEDTWLAADGVMNEGYLSTLLGLKGIPAEAEVIMIKRDIELAALTGGRLHIAHVSTAGGVKAIREAKAAGINVTAETTPHYLHITEDSVDGYNTLAKVNPPLRTKKDVEAIREGLCDATIDCIVTDHAPHHKDDKECEFDVAAFGISGLETSLALGLGLVHEGVLSLSTLIERMTVKPSDILKLGKGTLKEGVEADVIVVDINREFTVDMNNLVSKGKNTPFHGWQLKGICVLTIVGGKIRYNQLGGSL
ncbi:dihydroorotase, multifunctional complex type [Candidatus Magnetobacterium bavaricum]|uniref:Dihydroorotase n=1 Tax=Candidatus Magnetobacterium bavaricum TaxID=29290 RepID=A0A0F3GUV1_9BACT|nr:dihydroorotase, multifunctional complex type [Candidatus Magnetobacterium bavaricum]